MTMTKERVASETVARPTTYSTILVHADASLAGCRRIEVASRLARDFGSHLIGLGAEAYEPITSPYAITGFPVGEWVALVQEQVTKDLKDAEAAFRRDAAGADIEWRSIQDYPHRALSRTARAADLIVVSPRGNAGAVRCADPADVVMGAGRPVLMVPENRRQLHASCVVVAWKDTRECRRAVADALPFLQRAKDVIILAVCREDAADAMAFELDDVVANLKRHGVAARALVASAETETATEAVTRVAETNNADLIVAGAFGHSRLQEWALGGVTDDFVRRPPCFVLMSH